MSVQQSYANWQPWVRWNNLGDSWLVIDNEAHWGNTTNNQGTEWRCFTETQLSNHYITSIHAEMTGKTKYDNQGHINNKFNEVLFAIALTNHTFSSVNGTNGPNYLEHVCHDENGNFDLSDWQTYTISSDTMSLVDRNSTENYINLDNLNIYIPKNVVILYNYGTGCTQPCEELFSSHVRLGLK